MTLILTLVSNYGVFQVADRLVSVRVGAKTRPFDAYSNKTVVFSARDGVVTIGYMGQAYLDRQPTDEWIAEVLVGERIRRGIDGQRPAAIRIGWAKSWPSLGQAIKHLQGALVAAITRLPRSDRTTPVGLIIAGWQLYRSKHPRPLFTTTTFAAKRLTTSQAKRHMGRGAYLLAEPDGYLSAGELSAVMDELQGRGPNDTEQILVQTVRDVAQRNKTVGSGCMCTMLSPPQFRLARIRYDSPETENEAPDGTSGAVQLPVTFAPWVVTRGVVLAPAALVGGPTTVALGPYELEIAGTGPRVDPSHPVAVHSSILRPDPPR